jgi:hypothetical protein
MLPSRDYGTSSMAAYSSIASMSGGWRRLLARKLGPPKFLVACALNPHPDRYKIASRKIEHRLALVPDVVAKRDSKPTHLNKRVSFAQALVRSQACL